MSFNDIPAELRLYPQWVVWKAVPLANGKVSKEPYDPKTGNRASVSDPLTWASFDKAWLVCPQYSGMGFVLTERDPFAFIDLDHPDNDVALVRQIKVYEQFESYSERSPSGKGLHILVKGVVPRGRRRSFIEVYSSGRFMTVTGDVFKPSLIEDRQTLLRILWEQMGEGDVAEYFDPKAPQRQSDEEVTKAALAAHNGEKFALLLADKWKQLYPSQSEADFAFIDILAFYTQNREQIERMFRASPLGHRDKAKRNDYVTWMVNKSFDRIVPPVDIDLKRPQLELPYEEKAPIVVGEQPAQAAQAASVADDPDELMFPAIESFVNNRHLKDLPAGLVGDIAKFIYEASPRPVAEVALSAAIGLMAGVCGRAYNVSGTGLNYYLLLLAQTGSGKEALSAGISKLMEAVVIRGNVENARSFIGPGNIRSDAGLIKWLARAPSVLSIINEFGLEMSKMSSYMANSNYQGIKKTILDLYNKSGLTDKFEPLAYSDKLNNTPVLHSPGFSILGESVPEEFYRWLDEGMLTGGLLPRFTVIEYHGVRPEFNESHASIMPSEELIERMARLCNEVLVLNGCTPRKITNIQIMPQAKKVFDDLNKFVDAEMRRTAMNVNHHLWNRVHLKVIKLAGLLAVGVDHINPTITEQQAEWAKSLVISDVSNMLNHFAMGLVGDANEETRQLKDTRDVLRWYMGASVDKLVNYQVPREIAEAGLVPFSFFQRRLMGIASFRKDRNGPSRALVRAIQLLCDADILAEIPLHQLLTLFPNSRRRGKYYKITAPEALRAN